MSRTKLIRREEIPELVRIYRAMERISQRELGSRIGVSFMTISNIERGNFKASEETIKMLVQEIGYSLRDDR